MATSKLFMQAINLETEVKTELRICREEYEMMASMLLDKLPLPAQLRKNIETKMGGCFRFQKISPAYNQEARNSVKFYAMQVCRRICKGFLSENSIWRFVMS